MAHTSIILQVRIASSRLPGKLMLPLCGISIFEHILMRLMGAKMSDSVVVATTVDTVPHIEPVLERYPAIIHIGSEEDVLLRFVEALRVHQVDTVIRATGDNPLVSVEYLDKAAALHGESGADLTVFPELPYGTGVEVVDGAVLEEIEARTRDPFEREHITQYLYRHESEYRILRGEVEEGLRRPELRLTVDTEEDYRSMCVIYEALYRGEPVGIREVLGYLDRGEGKRIEGS
jgi:spore coat polysaccharide biosynthesis protein SpsF